MPMWQLNVAALYAWSCHGFHIGQFSLLLSNLLLAVTSTAVVVMICRDRGQSVLLKLVPPLLLSAFLFGVIDLLLGPLIYGLVAVVPLAVGQVSQFLDLRNSGVPDVAEGECDGECGQHPAVDDVIGHLHHCQAQAG